jgi:hypothetical protein
MPIDFRRHAVLLRSFSAAVSVFLLWYTEAGAVPLGTWRMPLFNYASDFEATDGSPSRMFWDGITGSSLFDPSVWPRNDSGVNRWIIEPAVAVAAGGASLDTSAASKYLYGNVYHEARYGFLRIGQALDVDTRYKDDPLYPAHRDRFIGGRIGEAFLQLDWKHGFLNIGRKQRSWGPFPDRSCMLSPNPFSYDAVEWQLFGSFFEFRHLFAPFSLQRTAWDSDDGSVRDRYLSAHSLNFFLGKWVTLGVTETILFTRSRGFPDLQYINPASIYTVLNTNQEGDGNLMLGAQWNIHPGIEKVSIRGQVIFDDFQVDDEVETDKEPTHWGIDAGIFWRDFSARLPWRHLLKAEVTYASPWLYTVSDGGALQGERYTYLGKSLGLPFSDGLRVRVGATVVPATYGVCGVSLGYSERGGNTARTSWLDASHTPGLPFDTDAPVERRFGIGAEGCWYFKNYVDIGGSGDLGWVRNRDNAATGDFRFDPAFNIRVSVHFCNAMVRFP